MFLFLSYELHQLCLSFWSIQLLVSFSTVPCVSSSIFIVFTLYLTSSSVAHAIAADRCAFHTLFLPLFCHSAEFHRSSLIIPVALAACFQCVWTDVSSSLLAALPGSEPLVHREIEDLDQAKTQVTKSRQERANNNTASHGGFLKIWENSACPTYSS